MKNVLILAASLVVIAGNADAGKIGSAVIAWSTAQDTAVCYVTNIDKKDEARIKTVVIIDGIGNVVDLDIDNCSDTELGPYQTCFGLANDIDPRYPHGCVVDFRGRPDVRGVMEIRSGNGLVTEMNVPLN